MLIRVLIIDPDQDILDGFAKILREHDFDVVSVSNERDCAAQLRRFAPNVLVLEPDREGSWGRRILEQQKSEIPIVVVSRFRCDGTSIAPPLWLTKPISSKQLLSGLSQALAVS